MQSARESGHVEILMPCQVEDPGRGSFMVNPLPTKKHITRRGVKMAVWRAAYHIDRYERNGRRTHALHNEAFDYAVDYGMRFR